MKYTFHIHGHLPLGASFCRQVKLLANGRRHYSPLPALSPLEAHHPNLVHAQAEIDLDANIQTIEEFIKRFEPALEAQALIASARRIHSALVEMRGLVQNTPSDVMKGQLTKDRR